MKKFSFGRQRCLSGYVLTVLLVLTMLAILPISAYSADRLVVKDSGGNSTFLVTDTGATYTSNFYHAQGAAPGFWLDGTGAGDKGAYFVLHDGFMQLQRRAQGYGAYEGSPLYVNIDAPTFAFYVNDDGHVAFGVKSTSAAALLMASGAYCSTGGVWTNASSREYKKDIKDLTTDEAVNTLKGLNPVKFNYKGSSDEQHLGFIAEDVPELVATKDKKGMSSMDVVAVLTKVVQDQQKTIAELSKKMDELERELKLKNNVAMVATDLFRPVVK
jgi:hypothetical protein